MRIYTKRGDAGETGLLYGGRVSKTDPRCAAYGTVDEATSALGLARSLCKDPWVRARCAEVQRELFTVGAELATDADSRDLLVKHFSTLSPGMTRHLEELIDWIDQRVTLPPAFVLPGVSPGSAALDVARTVVRRAEREALVVRDAGLLPNGEILPYLNRLSDLVFMMARYEDRALPMELLNPGSALNEKEDR